MPLDSKKQKNSTESSLRNPNRIGRATQIKGDITSEADFRIDGKLEGSIKTSGKVVIGKQGIITGKVVCHNADIEGKFSGDLSVSGLLSLRALAVIEGDVVTAKLSVEPGATFNGTCSMKNPSVKPLNNDRSEKAEKTA